MRKPAFCICENKDADQFRGNREANQRLCFRDTDSTIPLLPKYKISSLLPSSVAVQPGLCGTWSETPKTGFLTTRLILYLFTILVSDLFKRIVNRFKRAGYTLYIMRQTACLVFNPIMVEGYAALFSCTAVVQASVSMATAM